MKYATVCLVVFAILGGLRFFQNSPIRSWKAVFLAGIPLSFVICYYISCAFLPPLPPQPRAEKVQANRAELERTFRRIEGISSAAINGHEIRLDFAQDKPLAEFKQIARQTGGTAANFLALNSTNRMVVFITVNGRNRYELTYDTGQGVVDETSY